MLYFISVELFFDMLSIIIVNFIFYLSACVNLFKVIWVINVPYDIFPWSPYANSTLFWLIFNFINFLAFSNEVKLWHLSLTKNLSDINDRCSIMKLYHLIFISGIIINICKLYDVNKLLAFTINSITMAMLTASLCLNKPLK